MGDEGFSKRATALIDGSTDGGPCRPLLDPTHLVVAGRTSPNAHTARSTPRCDVGSFGGRFGGSVRLFVVSSNDQLCTVTPASGPRRSRSNFASSSASSRYSFRVFDRSDV